MPEISLHTLLPDPEALLALEPEELAGALLQHLASLPDGDGRLNTTNFGQPHTVEQYPAEWRERVHRALMEAWVWLEREGLLAPRPGTLRSDFVFVTRRGRAVATPEALASYRQASLLPRNLLNPRIEQKVWAPFLRGDYDVAVFQAFKEVEVEVRDAGGFSQSDIGVDLMRKAFHEQTGPLSDMNAPVAERQALSALFAGAIGSYKNPHSHRNVTIQPAEAVEMIMLASHLMGIVEQRRPATSP